MKKILVATDKPFAAVAVSGIREIVEKSGNQLVLLEKYTEQQQLLDAVKDVDAIIVRSDIINRDVINAAKNLKIVVRAGAGYDNLDLEACTEHNIVAMNTPGQNSNAVAELVFGLMVYGARNFYNGKSGTELKGKNLGIHAYGNVGRCVAAIAKGFGMNIFAFDPFVKDEDMKKEGVTPVDSVDKLYSTCNYVSLHIPATSETKKSINYDLLKKMPKNATLINTARKEVICEDSLKQILEERADFKCITDIEPGCVEELNEKFKERFYTTPKKMGAQTEEANINAGLAAAQQIIKFFETGCTTFKVNK